MKAKVLIVDDHEAARCGLADLLQISGFEVSASVASGSEALQVLKSQNIDIVLLDVRMPAEDGLSTLEKIRVAKDVPVILVSAYENPTYVARAVAMGAKDYVVKNGTPDQLRESLRCVLDGCSPIPGGRMAMIQAEMRMEVDPETLPPELPLTGREAQVLRHIALGLSNKEIALSLSISVETVKEHVQNILRKIKANDRTDAAVRAVKLGLID